MEVFTSCGTMMIGKLAKDCATEEAAELAKQCPVEDLSTGWADHSSAAASPT